MKSTRSITVNDENWDVVKALCDSTGQSVSGLIDAYLGAMAMTIKASGLVGKKKLTKADVMRLAVKGISTDI